MSGFPSFRHIRDAVENGKRHLAMWRRVNPAMAVTSMQDMSYGGGGPQPNYYASAPGVWATIPATEGIYHGPDTDSGEKFLARMWMTSSASVGACGLWLLDYLAYVPFLDGDLESEQTFDDFAWPRYADGSGVQVMLVMQGAGAGTAQIQMRYVNQDGVERITDFPLNRGNFANVAGTIATSTDASTGQYGAFLRLCPGDSGVRAVRGLTVRVASGGVFALVAVKPIASIHTKDTSGTPFEIDYVAEKLALPRILNGAYLNFIGHSSIAATPALIGELEFIWP